MSLNNDMYDFHDDEPLWNVFFKGMCPTTPCETVRSPPLHLQQNTHLRCPLWIGKKTKLTKRSSEWLLLVKNLCRTKKTMRKTKSKASSRCIRPLFDVPENFRVAWYTFSNCTLIWWETALWLLQWLPEHPKTVRVKPSKRPWTLSASFMSCSRLDGTSWSKRWRFAQHNNTTHNTNNNFWVNNSLTKGSLSLSLSLFFSPLSLSPLSFSLPHLLCPLVLSRWVLSRKRQIPTPHWHLESRRSWTRIRALVWLFFHNIIKKNPCGQEFWTVVLVLWSFNSIKWIGHRFYLFIYVLFHCFLFVCFCVFFWTVFVCCFLGVYRWWINIPGPMWCASCMTRPRCSCLCLLWQCR